MLDELARWAAALETATRLTPIPSRTLTSGGALTHLGACASGTRSLESTGSIACSARARRASSSRHAYSIAAPRSRSSACCRTRSGTKRRRAASSGRPEAAASLDSEHVARVYESGFSEAGVPFLVMEYLEGEDLAQRLAEYGPPPLDQAIELVLQVCEALAQGHARGIVHRDLKPANLFCTRDGDGLTTIKLLDFRREPAARSDRSGVGGAARPSRRGDRITALHGAGAGSRDRRGRHPRGHLGAGSDPVRARDGANALHRDGGDRPHDEDRDERTGAAVAMAAVAAGAPRRGLAAVSREGPAPPVP